MRFLKKMMILVIVSMTLSGCMLPLPAPLYAAYSFNPNTIMHINSAYNGTEYFYYDLEGIEGSGIYRYKDGQTAELFYSGGGWSMAASQEYLYVLTSLKLKQISLKDGTVKTTSKEIVDCYAFSIDQDSIFIFGHDPKAEYTSSKSEHCYRLSADDFESPPEIIIEGLEYDESALQNTKYLLVADEKYDYVCINNGLGGAEIAGIFNKETGKQVFRLPEDRESCVIFLQNEKMIFANRQLDVTKSSSLSYYENSSQNREYTVFPFGYYFDTNSFVAEENKIYSLLQKSDSHPQIGDYNIHQKYHISDEIVEVNADDGSYKVIYETTDKNERIVGYANQKVYLYENNAIYILDPEAGTREEFCTFEKQYESYAFDLCGSKIFVWGAEAEIRMTIQDIDILVGAYDLQ
ncbi:MAG: hypothetical protein LBN36_05230 [Clostridiales Family XIII bacterium]|jgi:hypothetical protein|nr:hypothetical protein [Clostridiales Family XIII bacterium]